MRDKKPQSSTQSERFIKAAQELGTDDDPERFAERVRKLVKAPIPPHGKAQEPSDATNKVMTHEDE